jgi:MFS family permease
MHVIGRTSDIYGRKIFICIGLFIYALMSMGYALSKTALHLGTVRFLQGFAAGMIMPIATAYIGDIAPKGREGTYMGYFYVAFFLGFGIGPLIGGFLSDYSGMKIAFYTMGGFNFIAFILAFSLLPKIESHRQTNKTQIPYTTMIRESKVISGLFADSIGVKFSFYFAAGLELVGFLLFAIFTTQKTNRVKS